MSKYFEDLKTGLEQAVAIKEGRLEGRRTRYEFRPVKQYTAEEIRRLRTGSGMTQSAFAQYMGVSNKAVEAWEKGTNHPTGSACRLMELLDGGTLEELPFLVHTDKTRLEG
jgi:putative transcriptional regulator